MKKESALKKLHELLKRMEGLPQYKPLEANPEFKKWHKDVELSLRNIFFDDDNKHVEDFLKISFNLKPYRSQNSYEKAITNYNNNLLDVDSLLKAYVDEIKDYWEYEKENIIDDNVNNIRLLLKRFNKIARRLRIRHDKRDTLLIRDEYDVQDLLHALLKIFFDDIREEEYTPTYAGGASRIDFLLNNNKIAIEIKKTRETLKDKKLGEEILIDIQRYQSHPNVKKLICFIYDPEQILINPQGLKNDLMKIGVNLHTEIIISPEI